VSFDFPYSSPVNPVCHEQTVVSRFREVCGQHGDVAAISSEAGELSYAELDAASERVAQALVACLGPALNEPTAYILADKLEDQAIAALGALKAGVAVAFADREAPLEVHRQTVSGARLDFVLTTGERRHAFSEDSFAPAMVLDIARLMQDGRGDHTLPNVHPSQLARIVFTSGSTGAPKGVEHEQRCLVHIWWMFHNVLKPRPGERQLIVSPLNHITGSSILFASLFAGTTLCPYPLKERGVGPLGEWMADRRITHYRSGVTVFRMFMATQPDPAHLAGIRTVFTGGEKSLIEDIRAYQRYFSPDSLLISNFGSSECSSIAHWRVTHQTDLSGDPVPAGYASPDKQFRVVGDDGRPVRDGETGEIVVKSRYIARGYRGDPVLTAERFTFPESEPGVRIFRTGDFGRVLLDGRLECVGRRDAQVKVNGHRVECAGVESALLSIAGVELAAVVAVEVGAGNSRLTAFVKPVRSAVAEGGDLSEQTLREALLERVSVYAVPATIRLVESMPLTASGKIDRAALERELAAAAGSPASPPKAGTESVLRGIWAEALGHDDVGMDDSFFGIGGNSLHAARLVNRVEAVLGKRLRLRDIFDYPTVTEMAAYLDNLKDS
jgi:iturin family lipopeptide synthetase A